MGKYKITTDNLDWFDLKRGTIVYIIDEPERDEYSQLRNVFNQQLLRLKELHPDWVEPIE